MDAAQEQTQAAGEEQPKTGKGAGRGAHNRGRKWGVQADGGPKPVDAAERVVESGMPGGGDDPGVSGLVGDQLADMQHVYTKGAQQDKTQGQRTCRRWLRDDPRGFMAAKTKLEEAAMVPVEKESAQLEEEDKGSAGCEEMYERLLGEWGEELR